MSEPAPLTVGDPERIGGYRLSGVLGDGGQGVVYLGHDPAGRKVAIKVLHVRMATDPEVRERFMREAEITRRVAAFCTAQVLDGGIAGDRPYLVSEYIPGPSLRELVTGDGPRTGSGLDRLAVATLTALAAIHRAGIVHRDFKPDNVIMGPEGPVVIDFGIARVLAATTTRSGLVGTPAYLSPEQLDGHQAGTASDVFSWAATMVFAATRHPAFPGAIPAAVMNAVSNREPDLAGVPERVRPLLAACLAKDPGARPTVADLLAVLTREESSTVESSTKESRAEESSTVDHRPRGPAPPPPVSRVPRRSVRGRLVAATAIVTALIPAAVVFWLWQPESPESSTPPSTNPSGTSALSSPSSSATGSSGTSAPSPGQTPKAVPFGMPVGKPFTGHSGGVHWMAVVESQGRPVVVSGGNDEKGHTVRVWDLATRKQIGRPITGYAVAVTELAGRPVVLSGDHNGIRVWDLVTRRQIGGLLTGPGRGLASILVAEVAGRPVVVSTGYGKIYMWDLATHERIGSPFTVYNYSVESMAVTELEGRPVLVSGGYADSTVRVWDLATRKQVGSPFTGYTEDGLSVKLTVAELEGRPVLVAGVAGGDDSTVRVWDLATREQIGSPFTGHTSGVESVAVTEVAGRPVVVSGGYDGVRVWDLATRRQIGRPSTGRTQEITTMLVTRLRGRPVVVSADFDGEIRVWSLTPPSAAPGS
ncbi:WD40 repeat domain-containing serine/threonine protein kinase [Streptosporangium amethystogenes]|uniref:WD40 repeat domain-containing serine/threonine protein kinase n=1 Tax=Streptosporangium amethystogenes TaxID=2002 RepID=UPI000691C7C8|nr:serine/threonine-protein kinase [Streptosporangium amethystogenes]